MPFSPPSSRPLEISDALVDQMTQRLPKRALTQLFRSGSMTLAEAQRRGWQYNNVGQLLDSYGVNLQDRVRKALEELPPLPEGRIDIEFAFEQLQGEANPFLRAIENLIEASPPQTAL